MLGVGCPASSCDTSAGEWTSESSTEAASEVLELQEFLCPAELFLLNCAFDDFVYQLDTQN